MFVGYRIDTDIKKITTTYSDFSEIYVLHIIYMIQTIVFLLSVSAFCLFPEVNCKMQTNNQSFSNLTFISWFSAKVANLKNNILKKYVLVVSRYTLGKK